MADVETQVFISYHRADVEAAEQVRAQLVAHGVATWMDQYDIPAGAYWPDEIDKGLNRADFVVGLLSPDAVESRNVKNEWDWAIQNGKSLILVMTRSCVIPHRYVSINFIDATGDNARAALERLTRTPGLRPARPASRTPRTRYARSGGVNVAWNEFGSGDFDIVFVPGFISHLEHSWKLPALATHLNRFGTLGRVVMLDKRGTGMSDRAAGIPTLEERMDDIRAVMDAAGSDRAVLYGLSEGVPLSILFAATYPERTRGLMLYGGSATYVTQSDYPWQKTLAEWHRLIAENEATLSETWGTIESGRATLRHYAPSAVNDDALVEWFAEFARLSASPGAVIALDRMNLEVDVRGILSAVHVPTLVFHRADELDADIGLLLSRDGESGCDRWVRRTPRPSPARLTVRRRPQSRTRSSFAATSRWSATVGSRRASAKFSADDFVRRNINRPHDNQPGTAAARVEENLKDFPDLRITVDDALVEGDKVMVRLSWAGTQSDPIEARGAASHASSQSGGSSALKVKLASDGGIRQRSPQPVVGRDCLSPKVILVANSESVEHRVPTESPQSQNGPCAAHGDRGRSVSTPREGIRHQYRKCGRATTS